VSLDDLSEPASPLRHDAVTMACPVCQHPFVPAGRRKFCSDSCRAAAYRRRRDARPDRLVVPNAVPRQPITVYECDTCEARTLGEQRCETCNTWMRRVGVGGSCPHCDEPVAVAELVGQEVITSR
jgi:predicted nucleic acid-binding Zn ribbon protein